MPAPLFTLLPTRHTLLALSLLAAGGCSQRSPDATPCQVRIHDPAEPVNRTVFAFNRTFDDYLLAPLARGYSALPALMQAGAHNFAANFGEPKVFINDVLQGNGERSMTTVARFIVNTTLGVVGLVDVSGRMGLARHQADFGQTFGVWNIADGPIVELPLLGTHNTRDAFGRVLSFAVDPLGDSDTVDALGTTATVANVVDGRSEALPLTDALRQTPDYYAALRDANAQRRLQLVSEAKAGKLGQTDFDCTPQERP
ncbi:MlaA family lipoprotein [Pseudomonas putida]|uniref:MlaA family lipoprotein n=1 Tax=Pseudomonas putida TaxID=303 RepID=UPI0008192ADF|nr:VacJ family lipoprotein [Pseudomonas putida]OCT29730.1 ABC transporter [Pseudomonas putida]OCT31427.1 ABC transporter [Pseudomonas putida]OCT33669.1 ABC transporter [Pseudomonas putida]OCT40115.1 ABC transporter [Pseudomonas putida]